MNVEEYSFDELYERLGYKFKDSSLLTKALSHSSYANEIGNSTKSNERLEFLGDAVLDLIIAEHLFIEIPDGAEGKLTRMRSFVVNEERLYRVALSLDIGKYLRLGNGEEESGGRGKPSILADALEAIIAAIMLDSSYDEAKRLVLEWFSKETGKVLIEEDSLDYKSKLQEWAQERFKTTPDYCLVNASGPPHSREFTMAVRINGSEWGVGIGGSKKIATQEAARDAWIKHIEPDSTERTIQAETSVTICEECGAETPASSYSIQADQDMETTEPKTEEKVEDKKGFFADQAERLVKLFKK